MTIDLVEFPGLDLPVGARWAIQALRINGKSPALAAILDWKRHRPADYRKIIKVMALVATKQRVTDEKHVKKTSKPQHHGEIYEMRAHRGQARLFFFYDNNKEAVVVCTNEYIKGKGSQDSAFQRCANLRKIYLDHQAESRT